ncbi:hypothetical protein LTR56_019333 [Elasticomyces elasticus]|nr:hypothetical protein LTR56_019333 [Elasticomyces elasticus]KAK4913488.1 hypothetical protein LTR49_018193 [Elasticomyces elasticus]KAK5750928.1 hypothetical protein LTS12_019001 [Elasticomyces elasticus]
MPPKSTSAHSTNVELAAIKAYLAQKPDFKTIVADAKQQKTTQDSHSTNMSGLPTKSEGSELLHHPDSVKDFKSNAQTDALKSAASSDPHKANLGPVMAQNLGEPASKEELKKRSDELNKK